MINVLITTTYNSGGGRPVSIATTIAQCTTLKQAHEAVQAIEEADYAAEPNLTYKATILGTSVVTGCEDCKTLEATVAHLESLRPHWAKGYTSDGMAAQSATNALQALWDMLGAKDQTDAMQRLRGLVSAAQEFCERVDAGEVRSTHTYGKFKAALAR